MKSYTIFYKSQNKDATEKIQSVVIKDCTNYGFNIVHDIISAIQCFEYISAMQWNSNETRINITNISVAELKMEV